MDLCGRVFCINKRANAQIRLFSDEFGVATFQDYYETL